MKLTIVLAGAFAALSLVAPAWAETGGGDESARSACDSSVLPEALFTKTLSELSTAETLPVEGALPQENGLPALSERAAYSAFKTACIKSSVFAHAANQSLSDHDLIAALQRELELLIPDPNPAGNAALNSIVTVYMKNVVAFNGERKSAYLSKVLVDARAALSERDRKSLMATLGTYSAATSLDFTTLAAQLPDDAPTAACTSGAGAGGKTAALDLMALYGGDAGIFVDDYKISIAERSKKFDSSAEMKISSDYISKMFDGASGMMGYEEIKNGESLRFAAECEAATKSWLLEKLGENPNVIDRDELAAELFAHVIENGDVRNWGLPGVQRHLTYAQLKSILSFVDDPDLYAKLEAMLMLFHDGVSLPKNAVYVPPPKLNLPLSPSAS